MCKMYSIVAVIIMCFILISCAQNADVQTQQTVNDQQGWYSKNQPIHMYEWSLERQIVQQLYDYRIQRAVDTWSIWYSDTGQVIDGCPSKGFGIPYNTSLTNSQQAVNTSGATIDQAEPNGLYPGGSTDATWVMCVEESGQVFPQYVEPKVIVYTWPMTIKRDKDGRPLFAVRSGNPNANTAIDLTQK